jgi:hypothetical protein
VLVFYSDSSFLVFWSYLVFYIEMKGILFILYSPSPIFNSFNTFRNLRTHFHSYFVNFSFWDIFQDHSLIVFLLWFISHPIFLYVYIFSFLFRYEKHVSFSYSFYTCLNLRIHTYRIISSSHQNSSSSLF